MNKNNIPSFDLSADNNLFTFIQQIIQNYLRQYLFTCNIYKIIKINTDKKTLTIAPVVRTQETNGETKAITPDDYLHNVRVFYIGNSINSTTFNLQVGDYGVGFTFRNNQDDYLKEQKEPIANNRNLFNVTNTFFIPINNLDINENTIIKNDTTQIELTKENVNINKPVNIEGNTNINGDLTTSGNTDSGTYSTAGQAGVSGTFVDTGAGASGLSLTITNGIITAIG